MPGLLIDALEERLDLRIVAVIAGNGDALAAALVDFSRGLADRARQRRRAGLRGATGHEDRGSRRGQCDGNAAADAAAGTRYEDYPVRNESHDAPTRRRLKMTPKRTRLPVGAGIMHMEYPGRRVRSPPGSPDQAAMNSPPFASSVAPETADA